MQPASTGNQKSEAQSQKSTAPEHKASQASPVRADAFTRLAAALTTNGNHQ
jgi:hypothetical protein